MKQALKFIIDLTKIEGEGDFPCPTCGATISPNDDSAVAYNVVDVKTKEDGSLEEAVIVCAKCGSTIQLDGFEMLNEADSEKSCGSDEPASKG